MVDVRDPKEFSGGTIKGAINVPMNDLEKKVGNLPTDKPVVFFCGTGARAGEAYDTVKLLRGEVQASFLDANIANWRRRLQHGPEMNGAEGFHLSLASNFSGSCS